MSKYKKGKIVKGTVCGIEKYGVFVLFDEYYSGLIHISEISDGFVKDIHDYVKIDETIYVKILDVDEQLNQLKLSIKKVNYKMNRNVKKRKIVETEIGFKNLEYKLPTWINEKLTQIEENINN